MTRKYIRFNYFAVNLAPMEMPANMANRNINAPWDMTELLDYLAVQNNQLNTVVDVGEYIAEFERDTFIYDQRFDLYSFQVSKLRETNIPAIKRIGDPKEDLILEPDEYIGEFVTIVFDPRFHTVAVQSNLYSLNVNQIEAYLTALRWNYKEHLGEQDPVQLRVVLTPIVDPNQINSVQYADIYRKITIKGSSIAAESLAEHGTLNEVSNLIGRAHGVNFELTISLGQAPKEESLDSETIQEIIQGFRDIGEEHNRPKVEITAREDVDSPIEVVNLLSPRLTNKISIEVENRTGIGHEVIHHTFVDSYEDQRRVMARVLLPIE